MHFAHDRGSVAKFQTNCGIVGALCAFLFIQRRGAARCRGVTERVFSQALVGNRANVRRGQSLWRAQADAEFAIIGPMPEKNDCQDGWCASGPAPFANTPPMGLAPELQDQHEVLPEWEKLAPDLHEDAYAMADALWWSRKLGASQALGADVAPLLRGPDDARAVQRALAQTYGWWPADRAPRYWKSGGPSRTQPLVHAPLPEPGVLTSLAEAPAPSPVFQLRGAEAEIALRIGCDLTAEQVAALDAASALALVDGWCVALEWVDVRWRDGLKAPALAQLADGQCHGGLLLGDWQPMAALQGKDWSAQTCTVTVNDAVPQTFTGTHSLGDPAWLLVDWLQHVAREYGSVPAGTVVTTGTWCGCMQLQAGDRFHAEFAGLGALAWQF